MKQFKPAILAAGLLLLSACASEETRDDVRREIDHQDKVIRELQKKNGELTARQRVLETDKRTLEAENARLQAQAEAANDVRSVADALRKLEGDLSSLGDNLQTKPHTDGVAIELQEILLFRAGSHTLRESGKELLRGLAPKLIANNDGRIRVEGHTDSQPIRATAKANPMGNLQLSGRRALAVAHFLVKEGGLTADRVSFAGFGKHRPVAANDNDANMARNRRVEIVLLRAEAEKR